MLFQEMKRLFLSGESIDEIRKIIQLSRERRSILDHFKKYSWHIAGLVTICDWMVR